ncbi:SDR family oxidoreductase [Spongiibacter sp. KMU-158]|uniref:SDR family oxidoreductase n=1 Tax=Spongiibacter pelagi TaxID=2760804 RepID=A0A927GWR8_9GAMM|nr:SDR family oxidoreductase [Spongiibacter pelagi]MBD2859398.1 SDR family oxidoreductase [Spongiibacter pelagi]
MPEAILITGAAGYIGSKLAERLSNSFEVVGVDIREPLKPCGKFYCCDIRDPQLKTIVAENNIKRVVHLASVLESSKDEQRDYDIDVNGTRNVIEACLEGKVEQLIVTSSGAAYGYHADSPAWIDEQDALRGNLEIPYSHHKYLVEQLLAETRQQHPGLKQLVLRPGTVLGANTRNQITNLFEKRFVLGIRGSDTPFVFIWDEDVLGVIEQGLRNGQQGIFNLAGDGCLSIAEIAQRLKKPLLKLPAALIRSALGVGHALGLSRYSPVQVKFIRYRPVLHNRRLKEEFGYQLQKTSAETFDYFLEHARARGQIA